jgi:cation transporter-like permease
MSWARQPSSWTAIAVAVAVLAGVLAVVAEMWTGIGNSGISTAGWVAMTLGVLFTLVLGVGLMALVFISSRRGYDEPDRPPDRERR